MPAKCARKSDPGQCPWPVVTAVKHGAANAMSCVCARTLTPHPRQVVLGPAVPGKTGAREIGQDRLTYHGGALSLAPVHAQLRDYFVLQSITVAVSMFRLLKYLALNPIFGGLVETFIIIKMQLLQFVLIVCALNVGFAYMAVLLFGDVLEVNPASLTVACLLPPVWHVCFFAVPSSTLIWRGHGVLECEAIYCTRAPVRLSCSWTA